MNQSEKQQIAFRVSWITIAINAALSALKLIAGIVANSTAMVSDAVHTISDVLSTFIVIIGIKLSGKEADQKHPYGHERFESVAAIILAIMLAATGFGIGYAGIKKIMLNTVTELQVPGALALFAAILSISVKEGMYWATKTAAKKTDSPALMADAWHHRSDALSSVGSFTGIFFARLGFPIMDPIVAIVICLLIIKVSVSIFKDAVAKMTDKSCDDKTIDEMKSIISAQEGVLRIDQIKTRMFGNRIYVDVEISANGEDTLSESHEIAHRVHDAIEEHFENVKHCMVHINPMQSDQPPTPKS